MVMIFSLGWFFELVAGSFLTLFILPLLGIYIVYKILFCILDHPPFYDDYENLPDGHDKFLEDYKAWNKRHGNEPKDS